MSGYTKRFFIGGLSLSVVNISQKIVSFLLLPIFTFYLDPIEFGIIATYSVIISFLAMIYNPGLISSTQRLYYDYSPDSMDIKELIASSWWFFIVLPLIVVVLSVFFGERVFNILFKELEYWPYGFLAVLSAIFVQPIRFWSSIWIVRNKTKSVAIWSLVKLLTGVVFSLLFVVILKFGALGRIYGMIAGNLLLFLVAFFYIVRFVGFNFSKKRLLNSLCLGLPLVFSVFSYVILDISDRYMIEKIIGLSELGIYDIGYTISSAPLIIIVGFNAVWQPIFYENMNDGDYNNISRLTNYFILGFALISGAVIIFSNEIFNILINREYINAIEIIPWVVCGIFLLGSSNFLNSILGYNKKFLEIGLISLAAAILNVILNYFLIKQLGIIGAAISTCISYFVYFLFLFIRTKKSVKRIYNLKKLLAPNIFLLLIVIIFIMINMFYKDFNVFSLIGKIFIILFLLIAIFYSNYFSVSEKKNITDYIKKKVRLISYKNNNNL